MSVILTQYAATCAVVEEQARKPRSYAISQLRPTQPLKCRSTSIAKSILARTEKENKLHTGRLIGPNGFLLSFSVVLFSIIHDLLQVET